MDMETDVWIWIGYGCKWDADVKGSMCTARYQSDRATDRTNVGDQMSTDDVDEWMAILASISKSKTQNANHRSARARSGKLAPNVRAAKLGTLSPSLSLPLPRPTIIPPPAPRSHPPHERGAVRTLERNAAGGVGTTDVRGGQ